MKILTWKNQKSDTIDLSNLTNNMIDENIIILKTMRYNPKAMYYAILSETVEVKYLFACLNKTKYYFRSFGTSIDAINDRITDIGFDTEIFIFDSMSEFAKWFDKELNS
jgi:hypothetical protein